MAEQMKKDGFAYMSEGALVVDVSEERDAKEIPPCMILKSDGTGNRVAALIYGPENVIIIAGMNKVAATLEEAESRVKNIASPPNAIRLDRKTPCALTGSCHDCFAEGCI